MALKKILAKSLKYNQEQETYEEHTKRCRNLLFKIMDSEIYSKEFKFIALIAVICHDLGKINSVMQLKLELSSKKYIETDLEKIKNLENQIKELKITRHNILSGVFIKEILENIKLYKLSESLGVSDEDIKGIVYKSVILHHGSFDDYIGIDESNVQEEIYNFIEEGILNKKEYDIEEIESFISNSLDKYEEFFYKKFEKFNEIDYEFINHINEHFLDENKDIQKKKFLLYIQLKGLINLVDHGASSQERIGRYYFQYTDEEIDKKIIRMIQKKSGKSDVEFNKVQKNIRKLKGENILTKAFTGSGKTAADYRNNSRKNFFLVPNKISAEGFYRDSIFSEDEIGLIHGDINLYIDNELKKGQDNDLVLTERDINLALNFCNPYIICTIDQLLLSMFKYEGYEKVFAAIRGSNITVDEVHLLTPRMFLILLYFMEFTIKYLDVKFHLMTATMPKAYEEIMRENEFNIIGEQGKRDEEKINFILSNENEVIENKQNTKIEIEINEKKIIDIVRDARKNNERVLIIKNTIDESIETYKMLKKHLDIEVNLLHSRFKIKDKRNKFTKILNGEGEIWVTTQSVEIALDIDFENIITDLTTMECLIQRIGRCNRHNKIKYGNVYILKNKKDVYREDLKKVTLKILKEHLKNEKEFSLEKRKELLEKYYNTKEVEKYFKEEFSKAKMDIKNIYGIETDNFKSEDLIFNFEPYINLVNNKSKASKLFRDIDGTAKIILEEDYIMIKEIKDSKQRRKEMALNSISISKGVYFNMKNESLLEYKRGYEILKEGKDQRYEYTREKGLDNKRK